MPVYLLLIVVFITSCTTTSRLSSPALPEPLRPPTNVLDTTSAVTNEEQAPGTLKSQFRATPKAPPITSSNVRLTEEGYIPQFGNKIPVSVNLEGVPLPAFINEVFGNLLGLSFDMMPQVQQRQELITLRSTEPQAPEQLYHLARQVLANYGISIQKLRGDNYVRFIPSVQQSTPPSLLVTGLALPNVPPSHRPIFQFIPIKVVKSAQIVPWLQKIYQGHDLEVLQDETRNAIMLLGASQLVGNALEVVKLLDQPLMRGQHSLRIEPVFLTATELATQLTQVLTNEGIAVDNGSVNLLPLDRTNILIAFAIDPKMLIHIQQWTEQLDQLNPQAQTAKRRLFFYPVKNTAAAPLAGTINSLLQDIITDPTTVAGNIPLAAGAPPPAQTPAGGPPISQISASRLAVDQQRNALIFIGSGEEWARLLPVLRDMDQPVKQVLIEATVAEITLSDKDERGIDWVLNRVGIGGLDGRLGTRELGVGGVGLTYTLSSAGQVRAVLNAFASSQRATILQTPRLLVRSGSSATITVGSEIPTLTSQAASNLQTEGSSAVLQQVQYRSTGISLNITPIVYAGRQVDLTISQTLSESQPNESSSINSPVIFNRQINTELSLSDGHSVLLGGLISNNRSDGWSGVPILSEIPILGQLFRVNKESSTRTELVILIIPYIIGDDVGAGEITEKLKSRLELLPAAVKGVDKTDKSKSAPYPTR